MTNTDNPPHVQAAKTIKFHLFEGSVDKLPQVVEQYRNDVPHDESLDELFQEIMKDRFGLLAFQSFSTSVVEVNQMRLVREQALLELFDTDKQLIFLGYDIDDPGEEHIKLLKPSNDLSEKSTMWFNMLLVKLLFEEKFDALSMALDRVPSFTSAPLHHIYLHYRAPGSRGSTRIELNTPQPWYASFHFNATAEKLQYLLSIGVSLDQLQKSITVTDDVKFNRINDMDVGHLGSQSQSVIDRHVLENTLGSSENKPSKKKML